MKEYIKRWATALVLLIWLYFSLKLHFWAYILVNAIMVLGLQEYSEIHQKIIDVNITMRDSNQKLVSLISKLRKWQTIPQWIIILLFTYWLQFTSLSRQHNTLYMFAIISLFLLIIICITSIVRIHQITKIVGTYQAASWNKLLGVGLSSLFLEIIAICIFGD